MKKHLTLVSGLALFLSGCATAPEAIAPAYVSELQYQSYSCDQITEETVRVEQALAQAFAQQKQARSNDTVGVILLGLPVSSLSGGNVAAQVAQLKGTQIALGKASNQKNCARSGAKE